MSIQRTPHEWSKDALFTKAQRYVTEMYLKEQDSWQFGFWSALSLEMLVRASLANISPALIADGKDWNSILFAVGKEPNQKKFTPRSAGISLLLEKAENTFLSFTKEMLNFSLTHINNRNTELHSGGLPFDDIETSTWLPKYFMSCESLLEQIGEPLDSLFDTATAIEAKKYIQAYKDEAAQAVKKEINAFKTTWEAKGLDLQGELKSQATNVSLKYFGHRVDCPSCKCTAVLQGSPVGQPTTNVDEEGIEERQSMMPSSFACVACELKIKGYSKLLACGLGDIFISTSHCDALEYFNIDVQQVAREMWEEDNNE